MEALSLAIALSFDGFAVGLGAALVEINVWYIIILSFIIGILAIVLGSSFGNLISKKISMNISWLSGILLLVIAFLKIR
jgi:putative Mn2+ efflux pump MntP